MTLRVFTMLAVLVGIAGTLHAAGIGQTRSGRSATTAAAKPMATVLAAACASPLGEGVKTKQQFCDVIIGPTGAESVALEIPAHTGASTLYFDLHPRFEISQSDNNPGAAYQSHWPVVAVVGPTGDVIDRAAAYGEYRSTADLFDRLPGLGPGGFKVVGPGKGTSIKVTIPASISSVGIVGLRVEIANRFQKLAYPEPGRPVAIVSKWRIEYRPK
jgi:hypothetical protein